MKAKDRNKLLKIISSQLNVEIFYQSKIELIKSYNANKSNKRLLRKQNIIGFYRKDEDTKFKKHQIYIRRNIGSEEFKQTLYHEIGHFLHYTLGKAHYEKCEWYGISEIIAEVIFKMIDKDLAWRKALEIISNIQPTKYFLEVVEANKATTFMKKFFIGNKKLTRKIKDVRVLIAGTADKY